MENKSKLTLIIDGNWLLMSRWAVINNRFQDDEEMCREIQSMLIKSTNVVLRTFPSIDNIIFVSDGGSWRNDLKIPDFIAEEYKGNREQTPDVNWKMIFEYYEEFIRLLAENGITTCQAPGVEGDDWCWYWSNKLNSEGTNCIIWSMDKDLTQLVRTNKETGIFTICWNKNGATVEEGDYNSEGTDLDFFFGDLNKENNERYLHEIVAKSTKVNQINPKSVVIDKIIRGDAGDNIFPIILRKAKNADSAKLFRVSAKDLDINLNIHDDKAITEYIDNIISNSSYKDRVVKKIGEDYIPKSEQEIIEHFKYNVKLVTLEKQSYPQEILDTMNTYTYVGCNKNIAAVNSYILAKSNKLSSILDII